ncbi:MAG TPA: sodium:solute symporter [Vicinamibacteria bacterium]|nr:sodium:solute symporter [Vicinamibacteria bacterium]
MHPVDWTIVVAYIAWLIWDGVKRTKLERTTESYFLANRSLPWWAVGLSVMATQLSAITLVGTTGQGYADGMRFVQFYYGLPLAMIVLSLTLVPFFYRARVYTAYEYLERRFDAKTRALTSLLFLVSRGLSCSVIVAAPAVVLSVILGWNVTLTALMICVPAVVYTMLGGVQAVTWTDVKVMGLTVFVLLAAIVVLVAGLPSNVGVGSALHLAGVTGRLDAFDFRFTLDETYTFWSGLLGGLFLMLSYFGCDQSQVQRYLTARSVDQARSSLLMSAYWKIPLQALVLGVGVFTFLFYVFHQPPMLFHPVQDARARAGPEAVQYLASEHEFKAAFEARRLAAVGFAAARASGEHEAQRRAGEAFRQREAELTSIRSRAIDLVKRTTGEGRYTDVNYVFPTFITTVMPIGLVGLWIVAIITAATDSIAAELNSLATATVIDFYRRHYRPVADDGHYLLVSKVATGAWGVFACWMAVYASTLGSLIEVVNRFGSFFYGSILGVFALAVFVRGASGTGAFVGLLAGMSAVAAVAFGRPDISFLWHNVVGAVVVFLVGLGLSAIAPRPKAHRL